MSGLTEEIIRRMVDIAMQHTFRLELADPTTRAPLSKEERRELLTNGFREIAKGMGIDRFAETPAERLDQFLVMSVMNNHDTQGLLRSLVNSFMIAYSTPETSQRAFRALLDIEALRAEVAKNRGQDTKSPVLSEACAELTRILEKLAPGHSVATPKFAVFVGADRLHVMAPKPIKGMPDQVNGVIVDFMQDSLQFKAQ